MLSILNEKINVFNDEKFLYNQQSKWRNFQEFHFIHNFLLHFYSLQFFFNFDI